MLNGRTAAVILVIGCFVVGAGFAQNPPAASSATAAPVASPEQAPPATVGAGDAGQTLAESWNDFLHYTKVGRFDLAKGYGQAILQAKANPAELFKLVQENQQGYDLAMRVAEGAHDQ
jgi:hypothetical protein